MTDIAKLAAEAFEANEYYRALGMMNTAGLSYTEGKEQAVKYALAEQRAIDAQRRLDEAKRLPPTEPRKAQVLYLVQPNEEPQPSPDDKT